MHNEQLLRLASDAFGGLAGGSIDAAKELLKVLLLGAGKGRRSGLAEVGRVAEEGGAGEGGGGRSAEGEEGGRSSTEES